MKSREKLFIILLACTPIFFFFIYHFLLKIVAPESAESIKSEIIGAVICGYAISFGLWNLYRKDNKNKKIKDFK
jgi:H+/Cl- antiporter ClcA